VSVNKGASMSSSMLRRQPSCDAFGGWICLPSGSESPVIVGHSDGLSICCMHGHSA
jgi:hypothetical protein